MISLAFAMCISYKDNMGYYVQGYGYIKYMTKYGEETKRYNAEKYLYYQKSAKKEASPVLTC